MFLLLSGEGASDIGTQNDEIGPMTKFIDHWVKRRIGYSLIELSYYTIKTETEVGVVAKEHIKPLSRKGKKQPSETRYFYNYAKALAIIAKRIENNEHGLSVVSALFRDADKPSYRGEWENKWKSMLSGFESEEFLNGVPMIPKPKSEAWILCALWNKYQNCKKIENESGNDDSPNSLKRQLEECLGEKATRSFLNDQIDEGNLDIEKIVDMPSLTAFKDRLDEVLDSILGETRSLISG